MLGPVSPEHPSRYMAALAGPLHVYACVQDLGTWSKAYIFLFPRDCPMDCFSKSSVIHAQPSDSGCLNRDVGKPHHSSSPGHWKGAWPLGSAPFALGQREPAALVRGQADPCCSRAVSLHLCTWDRGSWEDTGPGDSLALPRRLWELPCTGRQACSRSPPPWQAQRCRLSGCVLQSEEQDGLTPGRRVSWGCCCTLRDRGTARAGAGGTLPSPSVLAGEGCLQSPWGGGASTRRREGGHWGWRGSGCSCEGKGRGVGMGSAGGRTAGLHSPLTLASTSTRGRGGRAQRCLEPLGEKVPRPVPPPREEGGREEQACEAPVL